MMSRTVFPETIFKYATFQVKMPMSMCTSLRRNLVREENIGRGVRTLGLNLTSVNLLCNFGQDTNTTLPEPQCPHLSQP